MFTFYICIIIIIMIIMIIIIICIDNVIVAVGLISQYLSGALPSVQHNTVGHFILSFLF